MGIQEITPNASPVSQVKNDGVRKKKAKEQGKENAPADSATLSSEAISKFESLQSNRIDEIRKKIKSGYYLGKEVTEKVADQLLKAIRKTE